MIRSFPCGLLQARHNPPSRRARPSASSVSRMRGRVFFQLPLPVKCAAMAASGSGAGALASTCATARTCSGKLAGQGRASTSGAGAALGGVADFFDVLFFLKEDFKDK